MGTKAMQGEALTAGSVESSTDASPSPSRVLVQVAEAKRSDARPPKPLSMLRVEQLVHAAEEGEEPPLLLLDADLRVVDGWHWVYAARRLKWPTLSGTVLPGSTHQVRMQAISRELSGAALPRLQRLTHAVQWVADMEAEYGKPPPGRPPRGVERWNFKKVAAERFGMSESTIENHYRRWTRLDEKVLQALDEGLTLEAATQLAKLPRDRQLELLDDACRLGPKELKKHVDAALRNQGPVTEPIGEEPALDQERQAGSAGGEGGPLSTREPDSGHIAREDESPMTSPAGAAPGASEAPSERLARVRLAMTALRRALGAVSLPEVAEGQRAEMEELARELEGMGDLCKSMARDICGALRPEAPEALH